MPIYEYRCQHCEERFEQLVPLQADYPPVTCPYCGRRTPLHWPDATGALVKAQGERLFECFATAVTILREFGRACGYLV